MFKNLTLCASFLLFTSSVVASAPAHAQVIVRLPGDHDHGDRGPHGGRGGDGDRGDRGDRGGREDRGGPWDRGGRDWDHRGGGGWDRGDNRWGGYRHGEREDHRWRWRDSGGHDRGDWDRWRYRSRGHGCDIVGYGFGCRSIADGPLIIIDLLGDIYCYRRDYRGYPVNVYCPDDWWDY